MDPVTFKRAITDHLRYTQSKTEKNAHRYDWYVALAHAVRGAPRRLETERLCLRIVGNAGPLQYFTLLLGGRHGRGAYPKAAGVS